MKYTEASLGRIFVLQLEEGDVIPGVLEDFAEKHKLESALVLFLGGAQKESKVIVGPQEGTEDSPIPTVTTLKGISEALGVGTIFVNEEGMPRLHLHSAFGRDEQTVTGCTRAGVEIWNIGEVIIYEFLNAEALRKIDKDTGFELLKVGV